MPDPTSTQPTNRLCFLDTETTSLSKRLADVIEAAWAMDDDDVQVTVFDHTLHHADPEALRINNYYERRLDQWADPAPSHARGMTDLQRQFIRDLTGATIVAENYGFDTAMLLRKLGFEPWHYRPVELSSIAMTIFNLDRPESLLKTAGRLRDLGYHIPENDHSAEADVKCLRASYQALRLIRHRIATAGDVAMPFGYIGTDQ